MSITRDESELLEQRETVLTDDERGVIDDAFEAIYASAKARGIKIAGDDRAARAEAALVRLLIQSRDA